ncbi:MAG TPA: hypothetical protein VK785_05960 [Opitutaceae bacterium]|nr:hypothetical protein [Opitutaceae bacterium]
MKFVSLVNGQLRKLHASGRFLPPRFFGYYFQGRNPVAVSGSWTVTLDREPPMTNLPSALEDLTLGQYEIASHEQNTEPDFLLVHDRRDGACWLWRFAYGLRFVMATEPMSGDDGLDDAENRKLLGP